LLDVRTSFETSNGKAYTPANYDLKEHGPVLLREALASSLNIPAVLTLGHIGLPELIDISHRLGITSLGDPLDYDLSLALGGGAVRLVELSAAYGAFANGGYRVEPRLILEIRNLQNDLIYQAPVQVKQRVLDEKVAWLINDILSDRDARRLGFGSNSLLNLDRPAAVKTGTTSNFHDNWTVGYTPDLVVGVWSGNTNYEPMRDVNGLSGAAPIWHQFMRTVLSVQPEQDFQRPSGLVQVEVCALSGLLPTEACTYRKLEWFIEGTQPDRVDSLYRKVYVDSTSGGLADENTIPAQRMPKVVLDLPPQALPWARQAGLPLYSDYLNQSQRTSNNMPVQAFSTPDLDSRTNQLEIVSPAFGSRFYKAKYFDSQAQRIRLEAITGMELDKLSFWVDGKQIVYLESSPYQVWWTLEIGEHRVWAEATSPEGEKLVSPVVTFTVYE
jgi:membrane carboxypeptidase/penicillin-binding protein PbpC